MAGKSSSAHNKALYKTYATDQTWKTNRVAKLERHLVKHPDDAIAKAALQSVQAAKAPRRAKYKSNPKTGGMNDFKRVVAKIDKLVKGAFKAAQFEQKKEAK